MHHGVRIPHRPAAEPALKCRVGHQQAGSLMSRRETAVLSVHMLAPVASCHIRFTAAKRCTWDILVMRGMELCGWADTTICPRDKVLPMELAKFMRCLFILR